MFQKGDAFSSKDILDVGCGSGKTGISLQKNGFTAIDGIDPATEMLKVAGELGCYRNLAEGLLTETEKFPYEDGSYDGILCAGCFTVGTQHFIQVWTHFLECFLQTNYKHQNGVLVFLWQL